MSGTMDYETWKASQSGGSQAATDTSTAAPTPTPEAANPLAGESFAQQATPFYEVGKEALNTAKDIGSDIGTAAKNGDLMGMMQEADHYLGRAVGRGAMGFFAHVPDLPGHIAASFLRGVTPQPTIKMEPDKDGKMVPHLYQSEEDTIPAIHKVLDSIDNVLKPVSDRLQGVVDDLIPHEGKEDIANEGGKYPALDAAAANSGEVFGNVATGILLGKILGISTQNKAIKKVENTEPTSSVLALDRADKAMEPEVNKAYADLYAEPDINPNIGPVKDLVEHPYFVKALDAAVRSLPEGPWTPQLKKLVNSLQPVPAPNPTAAQMTGRYTPAPTVPGTPPQLQNIPVSAIDHVNRYIQRGVFRMSENETGLNREEAKEIKPIIDAAITDVSGRVSYVPSGAPPSTPGGATPMMSIWDFTHNLAQRQIQIQQAADLLTDKFGGPNGTLGGARAVANKTLREDVNNHANELEAGGSNIAGPAAKGIINSLRYNTPRPLGNAVGTVFNALTGKIDVGATMAKVERAIGQFSGPEQGSKALSIIRKAKTDEIASSPRYTVGTLLKYLPYASVKATGLMNLPQSSIDAAMQQDQQQQAQQDQTRSVMNGGPIPQAPR
jgi:hypothetical protein